MEKKPKTTKSAPTDRKPHATKAEHAVAEMEHHAGAAGKKARMQPRRSMPRLKRNTRRLKQKPMYPRLLKFKGAK